MSEWVGVVGLLITIAGFALTIWQLVRTARAAEATTSAIKRANHRMVLNHLLVLLPQLRNLEADLDSAIASKDRSLAIKTLVNFSSTAVQIAALLESGVDELELSMDEKLIVDLRTAAKKSTRTKAQIVTDSSRPLVADLAAVSSQLADLASRCAGLGAHYRIQVT